MKLAFGWMAAAVLSISCVASNGQISGTAYSVTFDEANSTPTSVPSDATKLATFNATGFNFSENGGNFDVGTFINSGGGISNLTYYGGVTGSETYGLDDTLFEFTGSAQFTNGQNFTVLHDDGVELFVNGVNLLDDPGSTSADLTPFTFSGQTGTYDFDFLYSNSYCCGADFETTLVTSSTIVSTGATPEPSSIALLGTGMLSLAGMVRRRIGSK